MWTTAEWVLWGIKRVMEKEKVLRKWQLNYQLGIMRYFTFLMNSMPKRNRTRKLIQAKIVRASIDCMRKCLIVPMAKLHSLIKKNAIQNCQIASFMSTMGKWHLMISFTHSRPVYHAKLLLWVCDLQILGLHPQISKGFFDH